MVLATCTEGRQNNFCYSNSDSSYTSWTEHTRSAKTGEARVSKTRSGIIYTDDNLALVVVTVQMFGIMLLISFGKESLIIQNFRLFC